MVFGFRPVHCCAFVVRTSVFRTNSKYRFSEDLFRSGPKQRMFIKIKGILETSTKGKCLKPPLPRGSGFRPEALQE